MPGWRSRESSSSATTDLGERCVGAPCYARDMSTVEHEHHAIDYIELAVTDMAAAQRFYGAAFGWQFNDYGPDYAGIRGARREMGGLRVDAQVKPGGPLVVLYSKDLDATLAAVRAAGGRVVAEPFGFPGGRRFHFADPSGNELAVWSDDQPG